MFVLTILEKIKETRLKFEIKMWSRKSNSIKNNSFGSCLGNLGNKALTIIAIPLARRNLPRLVSNLTSSVIKKKFGRKINGKGTVRAVKGFTLFILNEDLNHCMKNNILVKTLNVNITFSWFSAFDGNVIFSIKRKLKKISYSLEVPIFFVTNQ